MQAEKSDVKIEVVSGDITCQPDVECIVNAANARLLPGGGVAGAIHRAAGPGLVKECLPLAPIETGEAVITSGHSLPNRYVVHCLGPVYGVDSPADELLSRCYRNALRVADKKAVTSIAFPSISTGVFGYPMDAAASIALSTVLDQVPLLEHIRLVRFVLFGDEALHVHQETLRKRLGQVS